MRCHGREHNGAPRKRELLKQHTMMLGAQNMKRARGALREGAAQKAHGNGAHTIRGVVNEHSCALRGGLSGICAAPLASCSEADKAIDETEEADRGSDHLGV